MKEYRFSKDLTTKQKTSLYKAFSRDAEGADPFYVVNTIKDVLGEEYDYKNGAVCFVPNSDYIAVAIEGFHGCLAYENPAFPLDEYEGTFYEIALTLNDKLGIPKQRMFELMCGALVGWEMNPKAERGSWTELEIEIYDRRLKALWSVLENDDVLDDAILLGAIVPNSIRRAVVDFREENLKDSDEMDIGKMILKAIKGEIDNIPNDTDGDTDDSILDITDFSNDDELF